ncbi:error-prone DNA polymerase [Aureimonas endophytica]|uniref:Error-prone DNA polymerase n=1 Tax=Aureimonas endophytica TaxID=2027858 RepID=A0A916ZQD3_9HYPH|nr:error-prone DNA polymerase [Aureimonas endophytica]GGE07883.1 error-prone DNA polymerase [Aureimonas endophytica]
MSGPAYAELALASNFSFLRGASRAEELAVAADALGLAGFGLADRNSLAGVVRAYQAAREIGIPFRPGARLVFSDRAPDALAYPRDRAGWGRLCRLLSRGNLRATKGECRLHFDDLVEWGEDLSIALLAPAELGRTGPAAERAAGALQHRLALLANRFPGAVRLACAPRLDGCDRRRLARAALVAAKAGVPLMAAGDILYHAPERRPLQDVMTAIREHATVAEAGTRLLPNAERHLKGPTEMARLFADHPAALSESLRFFEELGFDLKSLRYEYPDEVSALGMAPAEALRRMTYEGAAWRYPHGLPEALRRTIEHELGIIAELEYEPYFLTVRAIVRAAREELGILCQGRGSAANSLVCYCLGITEVSPERAGLLFERFISPKRGEPPDIDIDFEHERREEIIQWIYGKYGRDNAALGATVISYRARSALREVGKAFGLSEDAVGALSGSVWGYEAHDIGARDAAAAGLSATDPAVAHVLGLASELVGFPRHLSQHVGGFVLTRGRIDEVVPVLNTGMKGRTIVEWDKDDLDELGILKIDILALGMLSCLRRGFDLLRAHYGETVTLASLSEAPDDAATYAMTRRADTLGVFQIESRAQMTMLPKLRPDKFYDLVIEVAIVRPGPIQGDMVHPYLRRKMGLEQATYPRPELQKILEKTLGVPLFQEQAMQIAIDAAGFTPADADGLRRAMATFKRSGTIHHYEEKLIDGMMARGYERGFAERCYAQIKGFGEYGFPESHAASFALLVYASAWLKCHYPDVFCAALLNAQPMGFYAPAQIVRDAADHGIAVRPVDVNHSHWDSTLEPDPFEPRRLAPRHAEMAPAIRSTRAVRLGLRRVKGLGEAEMRRLAWIRETSGAFDSVRGLWLRTGLPRAAIARLAEADAFGSLGLSRREAMWAAEALEASPAAASLPLFQAIDGESAAREREAVLPSMPPGEEVINDYRFLSLSLKAHPVAFVRQTLDARRVLPHAALASCRSGTRVTVAGLVLVRQRPGSAKGVIFMTLEDETGVANVIVWPKMFERFRPLVLGARFVKVTGRMQSDHGVIHVVAETLEDLSGLLTRIAGGAEAETGPVAPADHVRHPLRRGHPRHRTPAAVPEETGLTMGDILARADELRRPIDEGRLAGQRMDRARRLAIAASRIDATALGRDGAPPPDTEPPDRDLAAVLPRGRNFH